VITVTSTASLQNGTVIIQWGFTPNTACNGIFYVVVINSTQYSLLSYVDGVTPILGNGATSGGHAMVLTASGGLTDSFGMVTQGMNGISLPQFQFDGFLGESLRVSVFVE
jgi:hypothetical protein